jgi:N-acetylneuraminate synthase/sialic acid synthase
MPTLTINGTLIQDDGEAYVIAEIGNNHQGDLEICKQMFRAAKECGANAVKLQKRDNRSLFTKAAYNQVYNSENAFGKTYGEHREFLEFGAAQYAALKDYARELGIDFFATAFDQNSADFLADFDMPAYKIASGDLTNVPLLRHVAKKGKPILLSTGGGSMTDVRRACEAILAINPQLAILQCTAAYPCQPEDMNLKVIETYMQEFPQAVIGLSDHQNGIAMAMVAFTLGARIFEKHFTLDRTWKGTDHAFSLTPKGLGNLVRDLHRARTALGDGVKKPLDLEVNPIKKMGKKIVAARDLPAGTVLAEEHLAFKCPADGIPPYELENVLGKVLTAALPEDGDLSFDILK